MNEEKKVLIPYELFEIKNLEIWINHMSDQGWSLEKLGSRYAKFRYDESYYTYFIRPFEFPKDGLEMICEFPVFSNSEMKVYKFIGDEKQFEIISMSMNEIQHKERKRTIRNNIILGMIWIVFSILQVKRINLDDELIMNRILQGSLLLLILLPVLTTVSGEIVIAIKTRENINFYDDDYFQKRYRIKEDLLFISCVFIAMLISFAIYITVAIGNVG